MTGQELYEGFQSNNTYALNWDELPPLLQTCWSDLAQQVTEEDVFFGDFFGKLPPKFLGPRNS